MANTADIVALFVLVETPAAVRNSACVLLQTLRGLTMRRYSTGYCRTMRRRTFYGNFGLQTRQSCPAKASKIVQKTVVR